MLMSYLKLKKGDVHYQRLCSKVALRCKVPSTKKKTGQLFNNLELSGQVEVDGQKPNHFLEDLKSLARLNGFFSIT
jgi:hypothetical protein